MRDRSLDPADGHRHPTAIERLIHAAVYARLPGDRFEAEREDVLQEVRLELERVPEALREKFAYAAADHRAVDRWRRINRRKENGGDPVETSKGRPDSDPAVQHERNRLADLLTHAYVRGADQVATAAEQLKKKDLKHHVSDLKARDLTDLWLKGTMVGKPPCIGDIGELVGIRNRRRSSETFIRVKEQVRRYLDDHGFDISDCPI